MTCLINWLVTLSACVWMQSSAEDPAIASLQDRPLANSVRVALRAPRTTLPVGSEVIVEFMVQNRTDRPVSLVVPGALKGQERHDLGMGLPLEHVFSGENFRGLEIVSERNPQMGDRVTRRPAYPVPPITLAPFSTVGLRFDVARFYPGLHQSGIYRLSWRPYGGAVETEPLTIEVVQYQQILVDTNYGTLAMQLLYDEAPRHVANILELVDKRLYNGKAFHAVHANQFILGGCPEGTGTGKRPDGVCLAPEFNSVPFDVGTVGMALIASDANSASCQFFICLSRQPAWDGRYTAFARVRGPASLETLRKLGSVAVGDDHRPLEPLIIKSMTATDAPFIPREMR